MNISDTIRQVTAPWGVELDQTALQRCEKFADLLIEKNKVMNLTAITEEDKVARLHFADCLYLLSCAELRGKKIIDVGCGGGFPSLPLLCAVPELDILGLDSTAKRINFVTESARELGVGGRFVAARAEEYALKNRERFDIATSRAVAGLNVLLELTVPLLKVGGLAIAYKGPAVAEEPWESAGKALGCTLAIKTAPVIRGEERRLAIAKKTVPTPARYPRKPGEPGRKPL